MSRKLSHFHTVFAASPGNSTISPMPQAPAMEKIIFPRPSGPAGNKFLLQFHRAPYYHSFTIPPHPQVPAGCFFTISLSRATSNPFSITIALSQALGPTGKSCFSSFVHPGPPKKYCIIQFHRAPRYYHFTISPHPQDPAEKNQIILHFHNVPPHQPKNFFYYNSTVSQKPRNSQISHWNFHDVDYYSFRSMFSRPFFSKRHWPPEIITILELWNCIQCWEWQYHLWPINSQKSKCPT